MKQCLIREHILLLLHGKILYVSFINLTTAFGDGGRLRNIAFCVWCAALLIASPLIASVAYGATMQVSSNLQAAIDAASPGDTLQVAKGTYDKITIQKGITLIGNDAVILAGNRDACVSVEANNVNISGFLVRDGFYGIKLNSVSGCNIANNTVIYCAQPGIALLYSDGNTITGNNASLNGITGEGWYGIYLSNSNNNIITDNEAFGNGAYGINLFPSCNSNTISGNKLSGNMYGLYMFTDCSNNLIEFNDMSRNTNSGIDLRFNCTDNIIQNNSIQNNVVAGLTLMESGNNMINGNTIVGNGRYGVQVQSGSDGNAIIFNNITDSQTGIFLDSSMNQIYGNRIIDNAVSVEDRGKNKWNALYPRGGNLWSDYQGQDEMQGSDQNIPGKDGFGDTAYKVNEVSVDKYPVMGNQVQQISIMDKKLSADKAQVGDSIAVMAMLNSRYQLTQVTVRAFQSGKESLGYARLVQSGDVYQGSFSTALLDPGKYDLVLSARDSRGFEMQETLGSVSVSARGGFASS
ncbi:Cell surface glycoprotein [uncultured archaeon]|nr:Cell surface glycoprotein [uncultured archaeon]